MIAVSRKKMYYFFMNLRDYQINAIYAATATDDNYLIVMPTGSGKTIVAQEIAKRRFKNPLWLTHRRELLEQTHVRAVTIQSLLSASPPSHDGLIIDEAHHYAKNTWASKINPNIPRVGFTATPERADGVGLRNLFNILVNPINYTDLISRGYLTDCDVFAVDTDRELNAESRALSGAISAIKRHGTGRQGFIYAGSVAMAKKIAEAIGAETVFGHTPREKRDMILNGFRRGHIQYIVNVFVLTEGLDVPNASLCILARQCQFPGTYLQMVGRILRPHEGKPKPVVVDCFDSVARFGLPTMDRTYTLDEGVSPRKKNQSLTVCPQCGCVFVSRSICPNCGHERVQELPIPKIYDVGLKPYYRGDDTDEERKLTEWHRVKRIALDGRYGLSWAISKWKLLFPRSPLPRISHDEKKTEFERFRAIGRSRGYKPGWAAYQYKNAFGEWPPYRGSDR